MLKRRSVWGGLMGVGFASLIGSAPILADTVSTNHAIGYGLALFGVLAIVVGGTMWILLSNQDNNLPRKIAKADRGSVANVGDRAVIINMPNFGDILATGKPSKEGPQRVIVDVTPEFLVGFFREHTAVQAEKLVEIYIRKWLRVAGPVEDVTSVYDRLLVTLPWGTYNATTALMFDKAWHDRVATLRRGSHIRVIGQIDSVNSMGIALEHCELEG